MKSCKLHTRVCSPRYTVLYIDRKKTFKVCFLATMWKYGKFNGDSVHSYDQWVTVKRKKGNYAYFRHFPTFYRTFFYDASARRLAVPSSCSLYTWYFKTEYTKALLSLKLLSLMQVYSSNFKFQNRSKNTYVCEKVTRSEWNCLTFLTQYTWHM